MVSYDYEYFKVIPMPNKNRKTRKFRIRAKSDGWILGEIKWNTGWRQYCFFPERDCIWSYGCLLDLIGFLQTLEVGKK